MKYIDLDEDTDIVDFTDEFMDDEPSVRIIVEDLAETDDDYDLRRIEDL